ncbi:hypothetical protein V6N13_038201 [Hibiscus sabdariffa]|uniref:RING-type domain-containing protein n=1 Tax=Hibiscus sabdariffa TaxID=183260 RepID=A0ABR2S2Z6_9ROSI
MIPPWEHLVGYILVGGGMFMLVLLFLVSECLLKNDELDLENWQRPVVDVVQSRINNENLENRLSEQEPPQNQFNKTSMPTTSGTVVRYRNGGEIELCCAIDCVICLEVFKDGDSCRVLPICKHLYHRFCIDQWLVKNGHCPLCRGSVHNPDRTPSTLSH